MDNCSNIKNLIINEPITYEFFICKKIHGFFLHKKMS